MIYPWQQAVWQQIHLARTQDRLPHALLVSGLAGCGNEAFVAALGQALLCLKPQADGQACGHCRSCEVYRASAHPDFLRVATPEDKAVISVDQIRQLRHFLELSCSYSPVRVVRIDQAEAMNLNAANSLLKSLEEPAARTHLLLACEQPQQLLPTIRSRCQQLRMPLPGRDQALAWLRQQNTVQSPELLLQQAGGRPLLALQLDSGETAALQALWLQQLGALLSGGSGLAELGADWSKQDRLQLLDWQLNLVRHLLQAQLGATAVTGVTILQQGDDLPWLQQLSRAGNERLWALYDGLLELKRLAAHPLNPQLFAENMLALWLKVSS
ncbi:MAG: DNA polymerase III subunit delta' [Thiolinea sp.]